MTALVRSICSSTTVSSLSVLDYLESLLPEFPIVPRWLWLPRTGLRRCQGCMGFQAPRYVDLLATSATWTSPHTSTGDDVTPFTQ